MSDYECLYDGCHRPAEDWNYCSEHMRPDRGPRVYVDPAGPFRRLEVGDELPVLLTVDIETYRREWEERSIRWSEAAALVEGVLDRWDPDHTLSASQQVELFEWVRQWLMGIPELLPGVIAVDGAGGGSFAQKQWEYGLAARWKDDTTFLGVGALVRDLIPLLVAPAITIVGGAPPEATLAAAAASLVGAWKSLTWHRIKLDDPDEIRVFNAVHEASWELVMRPDGTRIAMRRGAARDQLETYLQPWLDKEAVRGLLRRLTDRHVLEQAKGRWTIPY